MAQFRCADDPASNRCIHHALPRKRLRLRACGGTLGARTVKGLTSRQSAVLRYIATCISRGLPPSLRQIGKHMGIRSTNGVNDHLVALERKGLIRREELLSRGIYLTTEGRAELGGALERRPCAACGRAAS